jgi:hypothetical protein
MHENIQKLITDAMRAKDQVRLTTFRGVLAAFVNELVSLKRKPNDKLGDDEALAVIRRLVKQRKDSIEQFEKGGRKDLADNERAEMEVLEELLPPELSEDKIREIANKKIKDLGVSDKSKMGILIGAVIKETAGQADGSVVKRIIEELLK